MTIIRIIQITLTNAIQTPLVQSQKIVIYLIMSFNNHLVLGHILITEELK